MEAPRGVEVSAAKGSLKVSGRKDLHLESTEGEVSKPRGKLLCGDLRHSESYITAEFSPKQFTVKQKHAFSGY